MSAVDDRDRAAEIEAQINQTALTRPKAVRREVRQLPLVLAVDEPIHAAAMGFMDNKNWLVLCTDRRILLLDKVIGGMRQKDIPLAMVSSIAQSTGLVFGEIQILGAGLSGMEIKRIAKAEVPRLADAINHARTKLA